MTVVLFDNSVVCIDTYSGVSFWLLFSGELVWVVFVALCLFVCFILFVRFLSCLGLWCFSVWVIRISWMLVLLLYYGCCRFGWVFGGCLVVVVDLISVFVCVFVCCKGSWMICFAWVFVLCVLWANGWLLYWLEFVCSLIWFSFVWFLVWVG